MLFSIPATLPAFQIATCGPHAHRSQIHIVAQIQSPLRPDLPSGLRIGGRPSVSLRHARRGGHNRSQIKAKSEGLIHRLAAVRRV